jgi:hypothetical protein
MDIPNLDDITAFLAPYLACGDAYELTRCLITYVGEHGFALHEHALDAGTGQVTIATAAHMRIWILEWTHEA